jgi:hypothetical protein
MNRLILYLLSLGIFSFSCKKIDVDANTDPQGYADSQVVGTWKITAVNADIPYDWDGNGTPETDLYPAMSACDKDNLYIFDPSKTGSFKKNCNSSQVGVWDIYQSRTLIMIPDSAPAELQKMISMTSVQFVTTVQVVAPSGQTITLSRTWSRQ